MTRRTSSLIKIRICESESSLMSGSHWYGRRSSRNLPRRCWLSFDMRNYLSSAFCVAASVISIELARCASASLGIRCYLSCGMPRFAPRCGELFVRSRALGSSRH
ncbi:hypothetical protein LINGRAHAP2_LOCUS16144 [Linum grandiflorum]